MSTNDLRNGHIILIVLKALEDARRAMDDWIHMLQTPENEQNKSYIREYIVTLQEQLSAAMKSVSETYSLVQSKTWQVPSASHYDEHGTLIEETGPFQMVKMDDYVRLLHEIMSWERWTQGHVWITNAEYSELCDLKLCHGRKPPTPKSSSAQEEIATIRANAHRYRQLRDADPDSGPCVVESQQNSWGKWCDVPLLGEELDRRLDEIEPKK